MGSDPHAVNAPFSKADFLAVFARYNEATWLVTFVLVVLALSAVAGLFRDWRYRDRWTGGVLTLLWLWSGIGFHLAYFSDVNPAAIAFGVSFIVQGLGFFRFGVLRHEIVFHTPLKSARGITGLLVMTYAMAIYPLVSAGLGHRWPHAPSFGAPCPVDVFTLGLLLWTRAPVPRLLLAIPIGWALVAGVAAWEFGMHEDWGLALAAVMAALWLLPRWPKRISFVPLGGSS
jgi:hypothetical protein